METLLDTQTDRYKKSVATLAVRMRPVCLDDIVGQQSVVGKGSWLYNAIKNDKFTSVILYGPAGCGKTSIANVIAQSTNCHFVEVSAVGGKISDLRQVISDSIALLSEFGKKTILFVDEIHRFNRAQQDALLHAVEDNVVTLIGATTENPAFEVNTALISRCHILELSPLDDKNMSLLINNAISDERGLNNMFEIEQDAIDAIVILAGGDARSALNILELSAEISKNNKKNKCGVVIKENVEQAVPSRKLPYDKNKDMHYDIISAFIKSMRGSDPDAAVYWLARMLEGGEDPKFIARRILICASEDIGNADPQAICVASSAFKAVEVVGLPECQINLAQAAIYMALAPKSNSVVNAIMNALNEVKSGPLRQVPNHLRDRHRPGAKSYGTYMYPHDYPGAWVDQQYLPDGLHKGQFYKPTERGWESYRTDIRCRDKY